MKRKKKINKYAKHAENNYKPIEEEIFVRPISRPLARVLKNVKFITPNNVALLRLIIGVILVPYFMISLNFVMAGIFVYVSFLLDKLDGDLARVRKMASSYGAYIDSTFDMICWAVWVIMLAYSINFNNILILSLSVSAPFLYWFHYFEKLVYFPKIKPYKKGILNILKYNSAKHHLITVVFLIAGWVVPYFYFLVLLNFYTLLIFIRNLMVLKNV